MKIRLERSGGFTGLVVRSQVDTGTLPAEQAQALEGAIQAAGFFHLPARFPAPPGGADRFQYVLEVEDADRHHRVEMAEGAVPEELRPVIEHLMALWRKHGPG